MTPELTDKTSQPNPQKPTRWESSGTLALYLFLRLLRFLLSVDATHMLFHRIRRNT